MSYRIAMVNEEIDEMIRAQKRACEEGLGLGLKLPVLSMLVWLLFCLIWMIVRLVGWDVIGRGIREVYLSV